jgi:hypothetical protein
MRKLLGAAVISGALFFTGIMGASAAPDLTQDGLVNVGVGDVTILQDVNAGVAAQVVANVCGVDVGPIAILADQVNATGVQQTVCTAQAAPILISQNTGDNGGGGAVNSGATRQNGLLNVAVGDVTVLQNVNVGVAAQVLADVCGVKVGPIAALANQLNAGESRTVCMANGQPIILSQS